MLLDIINTNNYINVNISAIKVFGIESAIYLTELVSICKKAIDKKKIIDGAYFKVDRKYISSRTSIVPTKQLEIDKALNNIQLVEKYNNEQDVLKVNIQLLMSILANDDVSIGKDLSKIVDQKKNTKEGKRQATINTLKNCIECSNEELLNALKDWVEGVYANPNGYLSKKIIDIFISTLDNYAQGDLDVALDVVKIATIQGWKDCEWAINSYERNKKMSKQTQGTTERVIRVTNQVNSNPSKLSDTIF